jgi:hypothetical protein
MSRWLFAALVLLLSVGGGTLASLTALGVLPSDDPDVAAPRWIWRSPERGRVMP